VDEATFIRAVLHKPDDALPRLQYADWLQDNGQPERAEFIRVQIELAAYPNASPAEPWQTLRRREEELLRLYEIQWRQRRLFPLNLEVFNDHDDVEYAFKIEWRRGFVEKVTCRWEDWYGRRCSMCLGGGYVPTDRDDNTCEVCNGTGRLYDNGPQIVKVCPIREVAFTNKGPTPGAVGLYRDNDGETMDDIPPEVFDHLKGGFIELVMNSRRRWYFPENNRNGGGNTDRPEYREACLADLSQAAIAWAHDPEGKCLPSDEKSKTAVS
jgi:uncharacterized protein (TIGR02996 family)